MKKILLASSLMLMAAVGCQDKKPAMTSSVTDLTPTPAAPAYMAPTPVAVQPISYDAPVSSTPSYTSTSTSTAMTGGTYTVKKGDTLYGIAKKKYNDGKQWNKIAAANPGLSPSSLKVGQTITLP
ncbi:hypothetical protein BH10PLA1_BH10PLA1_12720 [soil metagenome]